MVGPVQERFSGGAVPAVPAQSAPVRRALAYAQVTGEVSRERSAACPAGSLPEWVDQRVCLRLGQQTRFVADARLVREVDPWGGVVPDAMIIRLTLPPAAVRLPQQWSTGPAAGSRVAVVADDVVIAAPLLTAPFTGSTHDIGMDRATAEALHDSWRR